MTRASGAGPAHAFRVGKNDVLERIASGAPLPDVLDRIVRLVERQATGMACSILLVDREHGCVRYGAAPSLPAEFSRAIDGAAIGPDAGSCGAAAYLGERVVVEDIAVHPNWAAYKHLALPHGLRACWSSPIFSTTREVLGTFAMYYREPHVPGAREVEWVDEATHLASIAISHEAAALALRRSEARYRETADRVQQIARLYAVSSSVNEAIVRIRGPQELYEQACRIAVQEGLLRLAWVGIYDEARKTITPVARFGADDGYVDRITLSMDDETRGGPALRAVSTGACVVVDDIATATDFHWTAEALARGLRSCATFPLKIKERPVGVLLLYADRPGYFRDEGLRVLGALADDISFALESAANEVERRRLVHDLGERVKELTLLHRTASLLQTDRPCDQALLSDLVVPIPRAWQYPEICEARIVCAGVEARTPGWRDTPWTQSVSFTAGGVGGIIEVAYLAEKPRAAEGPFLAEERALLQSLADMLSAHVERQHTQTAVRDANQRLSFHVSRMPLAYIVWSHDLVVTEWNPAAERIFGWTAAEAVGRHAFELMVPPEAQPRIRSIVSDLLAADTVGPLVVSEVLRRDGTRLVCEWFNAPLRADDGQITGYLSMVSDITERTRAEEERATLEAQLRQAQRIQSLGTLAGGIAHDFNNVLAAVGGNAELAAGVLPLGHPVHTHLERIQHATARAADLVGRILTFSRQQGPRRSIVEPQPIVDEVLKLLRATLPATIAIRTHFDADAPCVLADPTQIHQVVMNLGTNAAHAMGDRGGVLDVALDTVTLDAAGAAASPELREGRYARLSVGDTGGGMDGATLEHIFEPFFTTKPPGQGTGLGLSVVHGIMKSHDGAITVDSRVGHGTTFHLYFPAVDAAVVEAAPAAPETLLGHGEHVLYVDDEEAIVYVAVGILERLGYRVTSSTDALQALQLFGSRSREFDAVVTDLSMPGLSGLELAQRIREIRPDIALVLTSGYVRPDDVSVVERLGVEVISKPSLAADLGPALRHALDRSS